MTTAFVLRGGGSLGAVQVGMLAALNERASARTFPSGHRWEPSTLPRRQIALGDAGTRTDRSHGPREQAGHRGWRMFSMSKSIERPVADYLVSNAQIR